MIRPSANFDYTLPVTKNFGLVATGSSMNRFTNQRRTRKTFNADDLDELTASIRDKGVLQPILVRTHPKEDGVWQIIAGERRWRAAQMARLTEAPIIVKEMDDVAVFEVAIIENVQRADLNPLEEADAYTQLMQRFGRTQDAVAGVVNTVLKDNLEALQASRQGQSLIRSDVIEQLELADRIPTKVGGTTTLVNQKAG